MRDLPLFLSNGGGLWLILVSSAVALRLFIDAICIAIELRSNSTEFLNGVRTVLKRDNIVEALSICDATRVQGRLLNTAILNRDRGRDRVREALEEAGLARFRGRGKMNLLATIAQLAPLLGLLERCSASFRLHHMQKVALRACGRSRGWCLKALVCGAAGWRGIRPTRLTIIW